ncbi:17.1 kDa class II heat shock protein-like [Nymphaea colorata]|nr:17.1 kDa class II heat shock protein-like [Nymphaea colorata]
MDLDSVYKEIADIMSFSEEMEEALQPHARAYVTDTRSMLHTPADIYEHPNSYSFVVDMPGVEPQDVKVRVDDGILHVSGRRKKKAGKDEGERDEEEKEEDKKVVRVLRQERKRRARFVRKFHLPEDADEEAMEASYRHGVLTVTVKKEAKEEEPPKTKVITIPVS